MANLDFFEMAKILQTINSIIGIGILREKEKGKRRGGGCEF